MKTLIVYCSSHGTTEKAVRLLSHSLEGEVLDVDLKRDRIYPDVMDYDTVLIGGSIHAGNIQRRIKKFIDKNYDILLKKKLGLFLCCMYEGEKAVEQFNNAFPEDLRKLSAANGMFGGEFLFSKMNFLEKQIVKKVSGVTTDTSNFKPASIMEFASKFSA